MEESFVGASAQVEETGHKVPTDNRLVSVLRHTLPRILDDQPVRLAYLHGSTVTGQLGPFSDVDIALVVDEGLSPLNHLKLILRFQVDLADHCGIADADVRIINNAPLVFQGKVVCGGTLVYARDERDRIKFETDTRLRYFDYLPIHRRLQEAFFADLQERGLYG
jgi:predicted nucleotidyltransferase